MQESWLSNYEWKKQIKLEKILYFLQFSNDDDDDGETLRFRSVNLDFSSKKIKLKLTWKLWGWKYFVEKYLYLNFTLNWIWIFQTKVILVLGEIWKIWKKIYRFEILFYGLWISLRNFFYELVRFIFQLLWRSQEVPRLEMNFPFFYNFPTIFKHTKNTRFTFRKKGNKSQNHNPFF